MPGLAGGSSCRTGGHGRSPGAYIGDEQDDAKVLAMQDEHNDDVVAAIDWVKHRPRIDPGRVVVSGCSCGGIQTMITAARPVGLRWRSAAHFDRDAGLLPHTMPAP